MIPIHKRGFTLIELLLYVSISAILLLALSLFLSTLLDARLKNQTIAEVEQQGIQVMQTITQTARIAAYISSPATSTSATTLSIATSSVTLMTFDLSDGAVRSTEGSAAPITLTNTRVTASGLLFSNLSRPNTPGVVRVQFTLTSVNNTGRGEFDYAKTFYGSASLPKP